MLEAAAVATIAAICWSTPLKWSTTYLISGCCSGYSYYGCYMLK